MDGHLLQIGVVAPNCRTTRLPRSFPLQIRADLPRSPKRMLRPTGMGKVTTGLPYSFQPPGKGTVATIPAKATALLVKLRFAGHMSASGKCRTAFWANALGTVLRVARS